jgi:pentatricopeptide repeat protein
MMQEDGSPDSMPDSYTYTALLRVINKSQKWDLLPRVFKDMLRYKVTLNSCNAPRIEKKV